MDHDLARAREKGCRFFTSARGEFPVALATQLLRESHGALQFHRSLPGHAPTPLRRLDGLARQLGVGGIWVKDESHRFGLKAFKALGASYAIRRHLQESPGRPTFCTATDGNHGRAVARAARMEGCLAVVFVPGHTVGARIAAIRGEGARVEVVDGDYDEAVTRARSRSGERGWILIQDTAWPGYETVPLRIMAGYFTLFEEMEEELHRASDPGVDLVLMQAGVGSWAAAGAAYYQRRYGGIRPRIACVEPCAADGLLESALRGSLCPARGSGETIMAGLNCSTPSTLAWEILRGAADLFLAISDGWALEAMRVFSRIPEQEGGAIVSGESGAAGLGGLLALLRAPELSAAKEALDLGSSSRVLVVNTEGDTDPEHYRKVVAAGDW